MNARKFGTIIVNTYLSIYLLLCYFVLHSDATQSKTIVVVIGGFMSWSHHDGLNSIIPHVEFVKTLGEHYEVYEAEIGPLLSPHDSAAIVFAQLVGGKADFGKIRSQENGHVRFGSKEYEGIVRGWGSENPDKIVIVAHSFGAVVARVLQDYLVNGDPKEIAASTPDEPISMLYTGEVGNTISGMITLAGVMDGSRLHPILGDDLVDTIAQVVKKFAACYLPEGNGFYDLSQEHLFSCDIYHSQNNPLGKDKDCGACFSRLQKDNPAFRRGYENYIADYLSPKGIEKLHKQIQQVHEDTYYLSISGDTTVRSWFFWTCWRSPSRTTNLVLWATTTLIGHEHWFSCPGTHRNDGALSVIHTKCPQIGYQSPCPLVQYTGVDSLVKGKYANVVLALDHLEIVDLELISLSYENQHVYDDMVQNILIPAIQKMGE